MVEESKQSSAVLAGVDADGKTERPRINSVARAIHILLAIAGSDNGLTVKEISESLQIERPTTYHLMHTLQALKVVFRDEHRRYRLGLHIGQLSAAFQRHFSAPEYLRPLVQELADVTGETCYAVGWWQEEIVTLAVARGRSAVQTAEVPHGQYEHAHARAAGKLLLALAPLSRSHEYLKKHRLVKRTARTISVKSALDVEFRRIQGLRYSLDDEEFAEGVSCLAVPLEGGHSPFAIALSAPVDRMKEKFETYLAIAQGIAGVR